VILKLGQKNSKLVAWTIFVQVRNLDGVKVGICEKHTEEEENLDDNHPSY
jgi:hypothetical protein